MAATAGSTAEADAADRPPSDADVEFEEVEEVVQDEVEQEEEEEADGAFAASSDRSRSAYEVKPEVPHGTILFSGIDRFAWSGTVENWIVSSSSRAMFSVSTMPLCSGPLK